ncbi:nucleoside phosphorylase [Psychroflexus salis]|uniref:Uridine phosphorylase n=1 Tax=Psychroflexus salis TaxID=1526574 RepID=A0A917E6I7_9FLAO|nr:nucleoside phosphorylase [Psychroflexus salis]GGE09289.1 phosphorylase [Psychroflexus salis]
MAIKESELIINPDGSVYHLNLKPEHIADTIITVGDQNRVDRVAHFFDDVIFETQKREFKTKTGFYKGKKLTVISSGIGTDNIDIVLNELDALANIDFKTRTIKKKIKQLQIVRIGTSGSLQKDVPVDNYVASTSGVGFDGLLHYYAHKADVVNQATTQALIQHLQDSPKKAEPYVVDANSSLLQKFKLSNEKLLNFGLTGTNVGFYGPQGRVLRLPLSKPNFIDSLASFEFEKQKITNLEMETSAIYALAKMLGHQALSVNAIIANRAMGTFSKQPKDLVDNLIQFVLQILTED